MYHFINQKALLHFQWTTHLICFSLFCFVAIRFMVHGKWKGNVSFDGTTELVLL